MAKNNPKMKLGNKDVKSKGYGGGSGSDERIGAKKLKGPKLGKGK